jgi:polar amino acid transport system substrate-binding protein
MQRYTSALALLLALFFCPHPAHASDRSVQTVTEVFFPFQYVDTDGAERGFVFEIISEIVETAGIDTAIEFMTWTRAYKIAEKVPDTLIFSMMRTPRREAKFHWIAPVASIPHAALFSAAERHLPTYPTLEGYKAHSVCAQEGTPDYQTLLDAGFIEGGNLFPLVDVAFSSMLLDEKLGPIDHNWYDLLLTGRCEYRLSIPVSMWARTKLSNKSAQDIVQHSDVPNDSDEEPLLYLAASLDTKPETLAAVSKAYRTLNDAGRLHTLCLEHLPDYPDHCRLFKPAP